MVCRVVVPVETQVYRVEIHFKESETNYHFLIRVLFVFVSYMDLFL